MLLVFPLSGSNPHRLPGPAQFRCHAKRGSEARTGRPSRLSAGSALDGSDASKAERPSRRLEAFVSSKRKRLPSSTGYHPISIGLALPPLTVTVPEVPPPLGELGRAGVVIGSRDPPDDLGDSRMALLTVQPKSFGDSIDPDEFWGSVDQNLQSGRVRLVFISDEIPAELRRVIEFLNGQMNPAEVLGIEIRQFVGDENLKTLVPRAPRTWHAVWRTVVRDQGLA